jgi:hypothetical protein
MANRMKILIAYDGSECADAALDDLRMAGLPSDAQIKVRRSLRTGCHRHPAWRLSSTLTETRSLWRWRGVAEYGWFRWSRVGT